MRRMEALLFWIMVLAGAAALAPCVILPPWLEYQAARVARDVAAQRVVDEQLRLAAVKKQRDHLDNDPSYLLRVARETFEIAGPDGPPPRVAIPITDDPAAAGIPPVPPDADVLPELTEFLQQAIARYPQMWLFVSPETRPLMMGLGAILMIGAIVLVGVPTRPRRAATEAEPPTPAS